MPYRFLFIKRILVPAGVLRINWNGSVAAICFAHVYEVQVFGEMVLSKGSEGLFLYQSGLRRVIWCWLVMWSHTEKVGLKSRTQGPKIKHLLWIFGCACALNLNRSVEGIQHPSLCSGAFTPAECAAALLTSVPRKAQARSPPLCSLWPPPLSQLPRTEAIIVAPKIFFPEQQPESRVRDV